MLNPLLIYKRYVATVKAPIGFGLKLNVLFVRLFVQARSDYIYIYQPMIK